MEESVIIDSKFTAIVLLIIIGIKIILYNLIKNEYF